jgi:hypothetical protein
MFSCSMVWNVICVVHSSDCAGARQLAEDDEIGRLEILERSGQLLDGVARGTRGMPLSPSM